MDTVNRIKMASLFEYEREAIRIKVIQCNSGLKRDDQYCIFILITSHLGWKLTFLFMVISN